MNLPNNYLTRTFTDIFPSIDEFLEECGKSKIEMPSTEILTKTYYLLYARYGNSTTATLDENQWKYRLFSKIFQYAPSWAKRLELQEELRSLTMEQAREGTKAIHNHAQNPGVEPSTAALEELPYIDAQNTTSYKKSAAEGVAIVSSLLAEDVSEIYIRRFQDLFISIARPTYSVWF